MRRALAPVIVTGLAGALLAGPVGPALIPAASASPRPALAAVQVSADPYTNAAAQHATEVEPDTIAVGHAVMSVFQVGRWDNGCSDDIGWAFSADGGRDWQHGYLPGLTRFAFGYMVGDYEGTAVIPGGNAVSAFAVGGIASGTQQFNEAMYEPSGGAPITGGSLLASPAGAHPGFVPAPPPALTRTR